MPSDGDNTLKPPPGEAGGVPPAKPRKAISKSIRRREAEQWANKDLARFDGLALLDEEFRSKHRDRLWSVLLRYHRHKGSAFSYAVMSLLFAAVLCVASVPAYRLWENPLVLSSSRSGFVAKLLLHFSWYGSEVVALLFLLAVLPMFVVLRFSTKYIDRDAQVHRIYFEILVAYALTAFGAIFIWPLPHAISSLILTGVAVVYFVIGFVAVFWLLFSMNERRQLTRLVPDATATAELLILLANTHDYPVIFQNLGIRRDRLLSLETVAASLYPNLARRLGSGDTTTDVWIAGELEQAAAHVRSLKRHVALPGPQSQEVLVSELQHAFECALTGDLSSLKKVRPESVAAKESIRYRIIPALRHLITGSLPLLFLLANHRWGPELPGELGKYLYLVASLFLLVSIISILDPGFGSRVSALKDLANFPLFGGRDDT